MISYCIAGYRSRYMMLLADVLRRKTVGIPFEILLWDNTKGDELSRWVSKQPPTSSIKLIGKTPEDIGMAAYKNLFQRAQYDLVVQIDEDVLYVSNRIPQICSAIFERHRDLKQIVADVWQDGYTTGAKWGPDSYSLVDQSDGLFRGPIDGWFSVYHRSILDLLLAAPYERHFYLGSHMWQILENQGLKACLCNKIKVFHACGPVYSWATGTLDTTIQKLRECGKTELANAYESSKGSLPDRNIVLTHMETIVESLDRDLAS